jgi:hypothetical protein
MPEDRGVVWLAPPPPIAVLRAMNVVMRPLLASRLGTRIGGVMLLDFRGRRTGRAIRIPANYHDVDGVPMAFTDRPWRLNFEGGAPVTVTHRGRTHKTRGTLVPMAPDDMALAVRKSLDTGGSAQRMGIKTKVKGHEPSVEELAKIGPALGTSVIRFEFTP